jgi:nitroreductase
VDSRLVIIFARRSIRAYSGEPVTEEQIRSLLEAGAAAPSAWNRRPWHFVVVTDKGRLQALADLHPYGKMIGSAAVGIAVCGDPAESALWVQECSAVTQNILIAVAGLGLGGVWLGCHGRSEREHAVRDVLGIPQEIGVLSVISIGHPHPMEKKEPRTQLDLARVHRERW